MLIKIYFVLCIRDMYAKKSLNCYTEFSNVIWPDAARYYISFISSYRLIRLLHMRQILDKMLSMQ